MPPIACLAFVASGFASMVEAQELSPIAAAALDHVPIAVRSLDSATATYGSLGFTIKPGRLHPNSILNAFMTFRNGTSLELITASEDGDSLAAWYRAFSRVREGAAFVSLRTVEMESVIAALDSGGVGLVDSDGETTAFRTVALDAPEPFRRIFFIEYRAPTIETDSFLTHANTSTGIDAVWFAVEDLRTATEWLEQAGWTAEEAVPFQPFRALGRAFPAGGGDLVLVAPTDLAGYTVGYLNRIGPSIMGVSVLVENLSRTRQVLKDGTGKTFVIRAVPGKGLSLLVSPRYAHGLWLEFFQRQ